MPALNDKVSGSTASASAIVSSTIASGRGVAGTGGIGVDGAMVLGVFGVPGVLSMLDAFSALTNMSNLALHLLLCLPFSSEHALQSGVAPKQLCDLEWYTHVEQPVMHLMEGSRKELLLEDIRLSLLHRTLLMLFLQLHAMEEWDHLVAHIPLHKAPTKLQSTLTFVTWRLHSQWLNTLPCEIWVHYRISIRQRVTEQHWLQTCDGLMDPFLDRLIVLRSTAYLRKSFHLQVHVDYGNYHLYLWLDGKHWWQWRRTEHYVAKDPAWSEIPLLSVQPSWFPRVYATVFRRHCCGGTSEPM